QSAIVIGDQAVGIRSRRGAWGECLVPPNIGGEHAAIGEPPRPAHGEGVDVDAGGGGSHRGRLCVVVAQSPLGGGFLSSTQSRTARRYVVHSRRNDIPVGRNIRKVDAAIAVRDDVVRATEGLSLVVIR